MEFVPSLKGRDAKWKRKIWISKLYEGDLDDVNKQDEVKEIETEEEN